jgi:SAM-dependent methyltransferase
MTLLERPVNLARRIVRKARNVARGISRVLEASQVAASAAGPTSEQAHALALNEMRDAIRQLRGEVATQISFLSHDLSEELNARLSDFDARLNHLDSRVNSTLSTITTSTFETQNRVIHLDTSLNTRLNTIEFTHIPSLLEQVHESAMLSLSLRPRPSAGARGRRRPEALERLPFDAILAQAQQDFPTVFAPWKERLDEISRDFDVTKIGNAANAVDLYSRLFKAFVETYADGTVLDVGCGPFGTPFYLADYPSELVSGLEPLPSKVEKNLIDIVRGISEYLPWADHSFDTLISATSLDHCLALERSLDEMVRVLKPSGALLLWLGHIPGSAEFRPLDPAFSPADRFHLFHFDIAWFEPMIERRFSVENRVKLDRTGYSHVFYCLRPLP